MIVLDTNVISAIAGEHPNAGIQAWLDRQSPDDICTTTVNLMELRYGIETLPQSVRRQSLEGKLAWFLSDVVRGRLLDFDTAAAVSSGRLASLLRRIGRPTGPHDLLIAGICLAREARLATQNTKHFADTGVPLIDPFKD